MAELNTMKMVPDGVPAGVKPGTADIQLLVWPKGKPAKIVTRKSVETGKDIIEKVAKLPLFRVRGNKNDFGGMKLSGLWLDVQTSMWPFWEPVVETEDARTSDNPESTVMPMIEVYGVINEKPGFTAMGRSKQSVMPSDLPYRWSDHQGSFCYDKSKSKTLPLNLGSVHALRNALRNQFDNPDVVGSRDDGSRPRIAWLPGMVTGNREELKEFAAYEENFRIFESWAEVTENKEAGVGGKPGELVFWELSVVDMTTAKR